MIKIEKDINNKYHYAFGNHYDSDSNVGFSNTRFVTRFKNKKDRDEWVNDSAHLGRGCGGSQVRTFQRRLTSGQYNWISGGEGEPLDLH